MAKAFIAQVEVDGKVQYVGKSGGLSRVPYVFQNASMLKKRLRGSYPYRRFDAIKHGPSTVVITIDQLENGLKSSVAMPMSRESFMKIDFSASVTTNRNAIYKIRLNRQGELTPSFEGQFKHVAPLGRVWTNAGQLRTYISRRLSSITNKLSGRLAHAEVIELCFAEDGVTQESVKVYPILDFYKQSPSSRKFYERFVADYQRGSKSLEVFAPNPHYTSERSEFK